MDLHTNLHSQIYVGITNLLTHGVPWVSLVTGMALDGTGWHFAARLTLWSMPSVRRPGAGGVGVGDVGKNARKKKAPVKH